MFIHSNRQVRYYLFLFLIYFLNPETLLSFTFELLPIIPSTNSDMKRRGMRNGSSGENDGMMRVFQGIMQS